MILVVLFMGVYYVMSAPSQRTIAQESEYAIEQADLRSVAECAVASHNATIRGGYFDDICVDQYGIQSKQICMNNKMSITECDSETKSIYSFVVTATQPLNEDKINDMATILEKYYADAGIFGIFNDGSIIAGGDSGSHIVPEPIISDLKLEFGSLVYLTQYDLPDVNPEFEDVIPDDIICPAGTIKTYRFGRWQCTQYNPKTNCPGDTIWDRDLMECVVDETRKPLCVGNQTAVVVDDVWQCIDPFPERECPSGYVARLNYDVIPMEWECVLDPNNTKNIKKCDHIITPIVRGRVGQTLSVPRTSCTDCEQMIVDEETCYGYCVPDPSKTKNPACYSGSCSGGSKGFYFGFPNAQYVLNMVDDLSVNVPINSDYSQNRKFNCMDCSNRGGINSAKSMPPYVTVCNDD